LLCAVLPTTTNSSPKSRNNFGAQFRTTLAPPSWKYKSALELPDPPRHPLSISIAIGDGPADGLDVLAEMGAQKDSDDVVIVAFHQANGRTFLSKASQAGATSFFLYPLNLLEVADRPLRAIEKRASKLEGRRLSNRSKKKPRSTGLVGGSSADAKGLSSRRSGRSAPAVRRPPRHESGVGKELVAQACAVRRPLPITPSSAQTALPSPNPDGVGKLFGYERARSLAQIPPSPAGGIRAQWHAIPRRKSPPSITTCRASSIARLQGTSSSGSQPRHPQIDFRLITPPTKNLEVLCPQRPLPRRPLFRINVVPISSRRFASATANFAALDHFLRRLSAAPKSH